MIFSPARTAPGMAAMATKSWFSETERPMGPVQWQQRVHWLWWIRRSGA